MPPSRPAEAPAPTAGGPAMVVLAVLCVVAALFTGAEPVLVLAGIGGVVFVCACMFRPLWALLLLVAVGPLESAVAFGAEGGQLTPVKLAGLLCFTAFLVDAALRRRTLTFDRVHIILGLLLALAFVSTLAAAAPRDALSTTLRYGSFAGLYYVTTQLGRDHDIEEPVAWTLSVAGAVAGALALRNFFFGGFISAAPEFGDVNDLAFMLATTLPLSLWLIRGALPRRVLAIALTLVMLSAVVLSFSRGAVLAVAVGAVWHALTDRRHIVPLILGAVLATAGVLWVLDDPSVEQAIDAKQNIADYNVETRFDAWRAAVELATERPVLGVGPGNFGRYYFELTGRPVGTFGLRVVHNAYLDVAAELGFTGLILFGLYLGAVFRRVSHAIRSGSGPPQFPAAVRTALVIACVASITLSEQYFPPFWVLGALGSVAWHRSRRAAAPASAAPAPAVAAR